MKHLIVFLFCIFIFSCSSFAQTLDNNETKKNSNTFSSLDKVLNSRYFQMTFYSLPLIADGTILYKKGINFRAIRNKNIPNFKYDYDTYTQVLPLCFTYALKSCGVKSKSSWGKLITTTSLSTIIGLSTCHLIKNKSYVKRPDNSSNNSFPSGHTTMAFISAAILDKEYGETSYWYSFGGYSVAAITGLSRVANNRHWISDVLCGAGLGILSTELSYFITDAIFKDKYSSRLVFNQDSSYNKNPSFANLYTTYNYSFNKYTLKDNSILRFYDGASLGIEGTYFFSPYFGIGTLYDISNYRISTHTISKDTTLNIYSSYLGSYFSYPLFSRIFIGGNLSLGLIHISDNQILNTSTIPEQNKISFSSGLSLTLWISKHTFLRLYSNYYLSRFNIDNKTTDLKTFNAGASVALHF